MLNREPLAGDTGRSKSRTRSETVPVLVSCRPVDERATTFQVPV